VGNTIRYFEPSGETQFVKAHAVVELVGMLGKDGQVKISLYKIDETIVQGG
jgi:hypothetical protein